MIKLGVSEERVRSERMLEFKVRCACRKQGVYKHNQCARVESRETLESEVAGVCREK